MGKIHYQRRINLPGAVGWLAGRFDTSRLVVNHLVLVVLVVVVEGRVGKDRLLNLFLSAAV